MYEFALCVVIIPSLPSMTKIVMADVQINICKCSHQGPSYTENIRMIYTQIKVHLRSPRFATHLHDFLTQVKCLDKTMTKQILLGVQERSPSLQVPDPTYTGSSDSCLQWRPTPAIIARSGCSKSLKTQTK